MGIGLALGLTFGVVFWQMMDNVAFVGAGLPIGLAIGVALDAKDKQASVDHGEGDEDGEGDDPDR